MPMDFKRDFYVKMSVTLRDKGNFRTKWLKNDSFWL